ncbi:MAG: response regulator, partial [bacterium]
MLGPLGAAITMQEQRAALDRRQLSPRAPGARDPTSPAGPPGGSPSAPVASRGRVLLLEDEPLISRMLVRLLQRAGFEVSPAATLRDAAAALE